MKNKLLITGSYLEDYPRNQTLIKCLNEKYNCILKPVAGRWNNFKIIYHILRYPIKQILFLWPIQKNWPAIVVARLLNKNIIADFFWSSYEGYILDRNLAHPKSFKAFWYRKLDELLYLFCHHAIFDTDGRLQAFSLVHGLKQANKALIWPVIPSLETIDSIPRAKRLTDKKQILFYGHFIPLQGIEFIIETARLFADDSRYLFFLIGHGQTRHEIETLINEYSLKNVVLLDAMPYTELIANIKASDICLGIFGKTEKANAVIPNKILDYLTCQKPVITGYNPELGRYFKHEKEIYYCKMANPISLRDALIRLSSDSILSETIAIQGRKKIEQTHTCGSLLKKFTF